MAVLWRKARRIFLAPEPAPPTFRGMTRAFKAHPEHPAVAFLVRLHADLGGRIEANRAEANRLAEAMKHVEAVIRMFDSEYDVRSIAKKRRNQVNQYFRRGTMFREALDVLKGATLPMTVGEIVRGLLARHGVTDPEVKIVRNLEGSVRACLINHDGKTVERVGEGMPAKWRLIG
jgi:hypothetical protein